jgi:hypothetical protein
LQAGFAVLSRAIAFAGLFGDQLEERAAVPSGGKAFALDPEPHRLLGLEQIQGDAT